MMVLIAPTPLSFSLSLSLFVVGGQMGTFNNERKFQSSQLQSVFMENVNIAIIKGLNNRASISCMVSRRNKTRSRNRCLPEPEVTGTSG